mgnify:FL=1
MTIAALTQPNMVAVDPAALLAMWTTTGTSCSQVAPLYNSKTPTSPLTYIVLFVLDIYITRRRSCLLLSLYSLCCLCISSFS